MDEALPSEPFVAVEKPAYLVVFKPRGMHGAPLAAGEEGTLLAWCAERWPELLRVRGRKAVEGGLLHRLDRDTAGLVVFAREQATCDFLLGEQERGAFLKEYEARCRDLRDDGAYADLSLEAGFPPRPFRAGDSPCEVESAFRPYGPGRRAVRPILAATAGEVPSRLRADAAFDRGRPYRTSIQALSPILAQALSPIRALSPSGERRILVRASLERGFRHQVRCHLAWLGLPIEGDELYPRPVAELAAEPLAAAPSLALTATAVSFPDPESGMTLRYALSDFLTR